MTEKNDQKPKGVDGIIITFLLLMLVTMLWGLQPMTEVANKFGLGPGWPEILQGGFAFLCMILMALRAMQLARARRAG